MILMIDEIKMGIEVGKHPDGRNWAMLWRTDPDTGDVIRPHIASGDIGDLVEMAWDEYTKGGRNDD